MSAFASLINLIKLDLEKCPGIPGGLVHLQGMAASNALIWKVNSDFSDLESVFMILNMRRKQYERKLYYNALYLASIYQIVFFF